MKLSLPGLLVEYLINGSVALLWLFALVPSVHQGIEPLYLAPGIYVLGMLVDFAAFSVTFVPKHAMRRWADRKIQRSEVYAIGASSRRKIRLQLEDPVLAAEYEHRSSRDRIARGTIINLALLLPTSVAPTWLVATALVFCSLMWLRFEYASCTYGVEAQAALAARAGGD